MNGDDIPRRVLRALGSGVGGFMDGVQRSFGPVARPARPLGYFVDPAPSDASARQSYQYVPNQLPENLPAGGTPYPSNLSLNPSSRIVHVLGRIGFDYGTEAVRDKFRNLLGLLNAQASVQQIVAHIAGQDPRSAASLIWTLEIENSAVYAIRPVGAFAASDYGGLLSPLILNNVGIDSIGVLSGTITGSAQLLSGRNVPLVSVDQFDFVPVGRLTGTDKTLIDATRRRFQNLGEGGADRARNFVLSAPLEQGILDARTVMTPQVAASKQKNLRIAIDDIKVSPSPAYRPWAECYDVDVSFFNPPNFYELIFTSRWIVDVSLPKPAQVGARNDWEVIPR